MIRAYQLPLLKGRLLVGVLTPDRVRVIARSLGQLTVVYLNRRRGRVAFFKPAGEVPAVDHHPHVDRLNRLFRNGQRYLEPLVIFAYLPPLEVRLLTHAFRAYSVTLIRAADAYYPSVKQMVLDESVDYLDDLTLELER